MISDRPPYVIGFITPWHSQVISDQPGLSSVRVLLGQFSHNSPYLWCFLLVTFHGLTPKLLFGYEVQLTHIVLKVEFNLSLPMQNPTVMLVSLLLQSWIMFAFSIFKKWIFFSLILLIRTNCLVTWLYTNFEKTCVTQFRKYGNSASNPLSSYKAEHIWRLQTSFLNPTNTGGKKSSSREGLTIPKLRQYLRSFTPHFYICSRTASVLLANFCFMF